MQRSPERRRRTVTAAVLSATALLTITASAGASLTGLPPVGQVNDDAANSIFANQDAGVSDVVGGSLAAGGVNVPWATFEQRTSADAQQIFVRAFKGGAWSTQGFPASLNIDPTKEAEAPSIDFAGANRTVPWVSWYEPNDDLPGGATNIFASRFDSTAKVWIPEGQDRAPANRVPSLNIHTDRDAEDPSVAGGATVAGNAPVPWVAWQEKDGAATNAAAHDQIFVSKGIKQTDCSANRPGTGGNSVSQFCWQQVGLKRLNATSGASSATGDPTLDIDPTRDGIEPDIAFTGPGDTTPWVVWYETGDSGLGLRDNDQVFAAKATAEPTADGAFKWVAVGNGTANQTNTLDTTATHGFGNCAVNAAAEDACSLNLVPGHNAEDPRIAAGSLAPGGTAAPWVVWSEQLAGGKHAIFISRLVGGSHFELFNNGQPISNTVNDSTNPDITFSGNEPYVTWQELVNGEWHAFSGHFEGGATAPVFKLDTPGGLSEVTVKGLRSPVSSGCTANPFTADGSTCPGGAAGTPFLLETTSGSPQRLLAKGYAAGAVQTGDASAITTDSAHVAATADPAGATINAHVDFGTTTAYGSRTGDQRVGPATGAVGFAADLTGLPAGTVIHYRAVATTDFGTVVGPDRAFVTVAVTGNPGNGGGGNGGGNGNGGNGGNGNGGHAEHISIGAGTLKVRKGRVTVALKCPSSQPCKGTLKLLAGKTLLGSAHYSIRAGRSSHLSVTLKRSAIARIRKARKLKVTLSAASVKRTVTVKA
jgi:hypothetical protein